MEARRGETAGRLPAQHDSRPHRGTPIVTGYTLKLRFYYVLTEHQSGTKLTPKKSQQGTN